MLSKTRMPLDRLRQGAEARFFGSRLGALIPGTLLFHAEISNSRLAPGSPRGNSET
jgi:hypothetical protein